MIDDFLQVFSVQLAQVAYPMMSGCAIFWLLVALNDWRRFHRIEQMTRAVFLFAVLVQFNWLAVLTGAPWWIPDMTPYRPYIRLGWSFVAVTWAFHTVVMIAVWRKVQNGN